MNTWGISSWWASAILIVRESLRSFSRNRNLETAATLTYYGFLALMPLLLVLTFVLGWLAVSSEAVLDALRGLLADLFPAFDDRIISDLATLAGQRVWGVISVCVMLWSMTPFAGAARHAVVDIFKSEHRPAFLREKCVDLAVVVALMLVFVALAAGRLLLPSRSDASAFAIMLRSALTFGLGVGMLAIFYNVFAPVKLRWSEAFVGAIVAATLLALFRPLFAMLLKYNPNYGYAFGSLKTIFVVLVWVYNTFALLLFGAEISANTRRKEALLLRGFLTGDRKTPLPMSSKLLEQFVRRPEQGTILFREGDPGNEMYIVRSGAVRLARGAVELREVREGDYFGEMSMLLGAPRSATAEVIAPDTELITINERNLETILQENPAVVRRLLRDMAERLQSMNQRITG
jgi:membrane protein